MKDLKELFEHMIKDLYSAENQKLDPYKKMTENADNEELKKYFEEHTKETEKHIETLKEIADELGIKPTGEKCKGMEGLVKEAEGFMKEDNLDKDVMDAGMIAQAQRLEHYGITGYGTVRRFAQELNLSDIESKLKSILDEEYAQDERLTKIAESRLNDQAK